MQRKGLWMPLWGLESTPPFTKQQLPFWPCILPRTGVRPGYPALRRLPGKPFDSVLSTLFPHGAPFWGGCLVGGSLGFLAGGLQGRQTEVVLSPLPRSAFIRHGAGEGWRCAGSLGGPGINPSPRVSSV